ncbi:hypothetical protein K505DRAFT_329434 [Melanomma pulvis-pyrius CBS 109.77]|uniref:Uncharacterized protein n=1 Tax=Melanomma pulvis-pyrius CBS 109.77 TaxID=1314802 RepID=A0A6A6WV41_9PLEO|nr:hypothetical protein K505DRAFT_329434 [Melanomma pulvis-pyrius CBS 109.77]
MVCAAFLCLTTPVFPQTLPIISTDVASAGSFQAENKKTDAKFVSQRVNLVYWDNTEYVRIYEAISRFCFYV